MPIFEYECQKCHQIAEILVRGEETPVCPHCGSAQLEKQLSTFAAQGGGQGGDGHHCCGGGCGCHHH